MHNKTHRAWLGTALVGLMMVAGHVSAADTKTAKKTSGRTGYGFLATIDRSVGLTPEQRDSIRGLLAEQRQGVQTLHEQTDNKIRAILTPDQQKKFDAFLAEQKSSRAARLGQS